MADYGARCSLADNQPVQKRWTQLTIPRCKGLVAAGLAMPSYGSQDLKIALLFAFANCGELRGSGPVLTTRLANPEHCGDALRGWGPGGSVLAGA